MKQGTCHCCRLRYSGCRKTVRFLCPEFPMAKNLHWMCCCVFVLCCRSEWPQQLRLMCVSGVCRRIRVHLCSNPSPAVSCVWITNQPAVCSAWVYTHCTIWEPHPAGPAQVYTHTHTDHYFPTYQTWIQQYCVCVCVHTLYHATTNPTHPYYD